MSGANGKLKTSAYQVPSGKGGNITLALYQGDAFVTGDNPSLHPGLKSPDANVKIDPAAVLRSFGLTRNGELLIAAPLAIQIGGQPNTATHLWLPTSLFTAGGFSKYTIQSVADGHNDDAINGTGPANINQITVAARRNAEPAPT